MQWLYDKNISLNWVEPTNNIALQCCLFLTSDNSISPANKMSGETLTVECQQSILKLR